MLSETKSASGGDSNNPMGTNAPGNMYIDEKPKSGALGIILAVILSAAIAGGGSWYYFNNKFEKEKAVLDQQIDDLNTQIKTLEAAATTTESSTSTTTADSTANWKSYTNPTFKYTVKYPSTWTVGQAKTVDNTTDAVKNATIEIISAGTTKITILAEAKSKVGAGVTLSQYTGLISPKDKTTITGKTSYTVGKADGFKELVTITDPTSKGFWYFSDNSLYFFTFITTETTQSTEIKSILASFSS